MTRTRAATRSSQAGKPVRLQRILAAAGVAARRAAERLIEEGRVRVNGRTVSSLPAFADPEHDHIVVDGRPLPRQPARHVYLMLNKPARVLSVAADEPGLDRRTIMDLVKHPAAPRLFAVGRLGYETEGLVLLTNDGALANRLSHPRYGVSRTYRAVVKGSLDDEAIARAQRELGRLLRRQRRAHIKATGAPASAGALAAGATPAAAGGVELAIVRREADRTTIDITVCEGRTADIGELLAMVGLRLKRLERIAIGPLVLTGLARGRWRELERRELQALRAVGRSAGSRAPSSGNTRRSTGPSATPRSRAASAVKPRARRPAPKRRRA